MSLPLDLVGCRFARLTVLSFSQVLNNQTRWKCQCVCGSVKEFRGSSLKNGSSQSCGCLRVDRTRSANSKHGKSRTRIYKIWKGMLQRCSNPKNPDFRHYGRRGISVCEAWTVFTSFLADMESTYRPGLTLERQDNNKGYFKQNCCWATRQQQAQNRRGSRATNGTYAAA